MVLSKEKEEDYMTVIELFSVVCSYLINKGIDFSCGSSNSSMSKYIKIKNPKVEIRISNHWQENPNIIQIITLTDLLKIFCMF